MSETITVTSIFDYQIDEYAEETGALDRHEDENDVGVDYEQE